MLCITKQKAIEAGMTHHGRIFGVPSWVRVTDEGVEGAPKFLPLLLWMVFADWLYDVASYFMSADRYIEAPLRVLEPIEGQDE